MKPKILLAADGSDASAKAAKHVAETLQPCAGCEITLFHVLLIPDAVLDCAGPQDAGEETRLGESLEEKRNRWAEKSRARVEGEVFAPVSWMTHIPEPTTLPLFPLGLALAGGRRGRWAGVRH